MGLLRRNLSCFYCGSKSGQPWQPGLKRFECTKCDATNFLDQNGQITDPPISTASSGNKQYVKSSFAAQSPEPSGSAGGVFCNVCSSNQQIITKALAEYLPPTSDPRYREFEKRYPEYRNSLERRYPPVCSECEPKVQTRIRAAGYTAQSDYIRRMNAKTKKPGYRTAIFTRRRVIGVVVGVVWSIVLVTNLIWDVFGLLPSSGVGMSVDGDITLHKCLTQAVSGREVDSMCVLQGSQAMKGTMIVNFFSAWWNPILLRSTTRARGVGEFYKLQAILFVLRATSWAILRPDNPNRPNENICRALFGVMLMFNMFLSVVSLYTAQPVPHLVRFHKEMENPGALGPSESSVQPDQALAPGSGIPQPYNPKPKGFPIESLGAQALTPVKLSLPSFPIRFGTVDPAMNENYETGHDTDAMDLDTPEHLRSLTGSVSSFYREDSAGISSGPFTRKGVFKAPEPLQPPTRELRSRTRQQRQQLRRKESLVSNWDAETITSYGDDDALTIRADDDSDEDTAFRKSFIPASAQGKDYQFKQASFHAGEEETGLEGMLDFFGLKDEAVEMGMDPGKARGPTDAGRSFSRDSKSTLSPISPKKKGLIKMPVLVSSFNIPLIASAAFVSTVAFLCLVDLDSEWSEKLRFAALIWSIVVALLRLNDELDLTRHIWELSNILAFIAQGALGLYLSLDRGEKSVDQFPLEDQDIEIPIGEHAQLPLVDDRQISQLNVGMITASFLIWVVVQEAVIAMRQSKTAARFKIDLD